MTLGDKRLTRGVNYVECQNMLETNDEQIYVAELKVPSRFYSPGEVRREIPNPTEFGITRGYYVVRPRDEHSIASGYAAIDVVIEFLSQGLIETEDHAIRVGGVFSTLVSAFAACPIESPQLERIACIDIIDGLRSEHHYLHRQRPHMISEFNQVGDHRLLEYIRSIASIDGNTRGHLQSAVHWYGVSISADDPTVSYVAAWTGLECIGTAIDRIAHPNGSKAHCRACGNEGGKNRDRTRAGIDHMFHRLSDGPLSESLSDDVTERLSSELRGCFSSQEAHDLRSSIVHGLEDLESLVRKSSDARLHLIHVLNASIQSVMGEAIQSWMPGGDYRVHPDFRYSLRFKPGLNLSPYQNQWASTLRGRGVHTAPERKKLYMTEYDLEFAINEHAVRFAKSQCEEPFKRNDDIYRPAHDHELLNCPSWYNRPTELDWQEFSIPEH